MPKKVNLMLCSYNKMNKYTYTKDTKKLSEVTGMSITLTVVIVSLV